MSDFHDFVVGLMAILVGSLLIAGAAIESPLLMGLVKMRLLIESMGLRGARWFIVSVGAVSIGLGLLIASGWRWHW